MSRKKSRDQRLKERAQKNKDNPVVQRKIGREIKRLESARIDAIFKENMKEINNG